MGNQQPSTLEERLLFLAKNARFGDGYLWKHPKSKNYKMIFASTTPELLNKFPPSEGSTTIRLAE